MSFPFSYFLAQFNTQFIVVPLPSIPTIRNLYFKLLWKTIYRQTSIFQLTTAL